MNTILLPTDFSKNSLNAIQYAFKFHEDIPTRFILLHVFLEPKSAVGVMVNIEDKIKQNALDDLKRFGAEVNALVEQKNMHNVELKMLPGPLINSINQVLDSEKVNAIFMGTQGASGLKKSLVGSVTSKVIRDVKHPIFAIPRLAVFKKIERIAFASDFEPISEDSIMEPLIDTVQNFSAELLVVNVHKTNQNIKSAMEYDESRKLRQMFKNLKHTFHYHESENPESGIEQFVIKNDVDVLAMITRDHFFLSRLLNTSTVEKMSFLTKVPLFAIHN